MSIEANLLEGTLILAKTMGVISLLALVYAAIANHNCKRKERQVLPAPDHTVGRDYAAFQRRSFGGGRRDSRNHWVA